MNRIALVAAVMLATSLTPALADGRPTTAEARTIARDAAVFGFAIVQNYEAIYACGANPNSPRYHPPNTLALADKLYGPKDSNIVSVNNDTLYGSSVLDLRAEPVVLRVPEIADRYYAFQFIDLATNNFAYVGTRATGTKAGTYLVVGPGWLGDVPAGVTKVLHSPSWFAFLIARTEVKAPDDLARAVEVQKGYALEPLSKFVRVPAPEAAPKADWPRYSPPKTCDTEAFLGQLCFLMQWHVFGALEFPDLRRFARIGIEAGKPFERTALPAEVWKAVEEGISDGREEVRRKTSSIGTAVGAWDFSPVLAGRWERNYLTRSAAAWKYIYVNSPAEAVYPTANNDADGRPLDGTKERYVLEFPKGSLPPTAYFWSLTAYDAKTHLLVENALGRYSVGHRTPNLKPDADGTLRLYVQHESPGKEHETHWLPAPDGPFYVILRMYGPKPEALNGAYRLPPMRRVR